MDQECGRCIEPIIVTQQDVDYDEARQLWNRSIQKYPLGIAYCQSIQDVQEVLCIAQKEGLPIRIRNGGHHYEGYCSMNGGLVIDVSGLKGVRMDEEAGIVVIQGGVQNQELYEVLGQRGYPFPGGTCPTVGVAGFTLGGGWGYSSRYFGLGCDSLLEVKLVDAKGQLIRANCMENTELFWACQGGGGGNFGVVVELTYELPAKVESVVSFELYLPNASRGQMIHFWQVWQQWMDTVSPTITMNGGFYHTSAEGMYIYGRGLCYGSLEATKQLLGPFAQMPGMKVSFDEGSFLEIIKRIGATYPPYEHFKSTGRFGERFLHTYEVDQVMDLVALPLPQGAIFTVINFYGLGGKIKSVQPQQTAYYYRHAKWMMSLQSVWEDNQYKDANVDWVVAHFPVIAQMTQGSYVNFPYAQLVNYEQAYYGCNVGGLRWVKEQYDACNVFCFQQSVKP